MTPPLVPIAWKPCRRIVSSRFPPIQLFERVTDPQDLEAIFAVDALTNPRLRDEVGDIRLVPPEGRVSGPGASVIMAAFTHLNPSGSRFSDGAYGVFYAANDTPSLHGAMVFGGAHAQARLHLVIEVADRDARHGHALRSSGTPIYTPIAMLSRRRGRL